MPISVVNTTKIGTGSGTGTGTSPSISTTTGNTLVAALVVSANLSIAISDSAGNSWGSPIVNGVSAGSGGYLYVWECVNATGSATHTFSASWGGGSTAGTLLIAEIGGVPTSSARDGSPASQNDQASPFTSTNLATSNATDLLVAIGGFDSGSNPSTFAISSASPASGWTIDVKEDNASVYWAGVIATQRVTSTGTYNAGFTCVGANEGAVAILAYKESSGGGTTVTVDNATLTLSGQDVALQAGSSVTLPVTNAALTLTGGDVNWDFGVPSTEATLTLTGQDVTLQAGLSLTLTVDNALLALAGQNVNLLADFDYTVVVDSSTLTLVPQDVGFSLSGNATVIVNSSNLTLTGQDVAIAPSITTSSGGQPRKTRYRGTIRILGCSR